jgi:hypothetical protein
MRNSSIPHPISVAVAGAALVLAAQVLPAQKPAVPASTKDRVEIQLQRRVAGQWKTIDPGTVCEQNDEVRFLFRSNFNGYLYVMNHSTSGKYEQLFPTAKAGEDNRVSAGQEYKVPQEGAVFRISGPAGHELVYWIVTPVRMEEGGPATRYKPLPPPPPPSTAPKIMMPRCDSTIFKARGDCIDMTAGPKNLSGSEERREELTGSGMRPRELTFVRDKDVSVISSSAVLTGPVVYEFRLAHR